MLAINRRQLAPIGDVAPQQPDHRVSGTERHREGEDAQKRQPILKHVRGAEARRQKLGGTNKGLGSEAPRYNPLDLREIFPAVYAKMTLRRHATNDETHSLRHTRNACSVFGGRNSLG